MPPGSFVFLVLSVSSVTLLSFLAARPVAASSSSPPTYVPYSLVQEACADKLRQWGPAPPSILPAASDNQWSLRGSWWAGDGVPSDGSWMTALGTAGSLEFSFLQSPVQVTSGTAASVANLTSVHVYLVNGAAHPIPPPVTFDAAGVLNPLAGELCLACCPRRRLGRPVSARECFVRASVRLHYPAFASLDVPVTGRLEALDGSRTATVFFSGVVENGKGQAAVRAALDATTMLLAAAETIAILAQLCHVLRDPAAGQGVSVVGVAFQGGIVTFRWAGAELGPMIHSRRHAFRHLWASNLWVGNMAAHTTLALSWLLLLAVVVLLQVRASRSVRPYHPKSPLGALWLMGLSFPPYLLAWYFASASDPPHPFQSFMEIFLPLWLLPQALSSFAYGLGPPSSSHPLSSFFLFGVSACRLFSLAHTCYRPRSPSYVDIFQHLPRESLWVLSLLLLILSTITFLQQTHGGRFSLCSHNQAIAITQTNCS